MPFGCSVSPIIRSLPLVTHLGRYGPPSGQRAEIGHLMAKLSTYPFLCRKPIQKPLPICSILEGINLNTNNLMNLHTNGSNCTHVASPNQLGKSLELDCSTSSGCSVQDLRVTSYGDGFNKAGGGVFATQFASDK